jgi:hypothetical protein
MAAGDPIAITIAIPRIRIPAIVLRCTINGHKGSGGHSNMQLSRFGYGATREHSQFPSVCCRLLRHMCPENTQSMAQRCSASTVKTVHANKCVRRLLWM